MFYRPGLVVLIVGCCLTSLSTIIVGLRYYCRYFLMGTLGATDHLMLAALVLTWGNTTLNYYQDWFSQGFDPNQFRDPNKRLRIVKALNGVLLTWYIYRFTYVIALCFVKLSILSFYRSIASHQTFRRAIYATIVVISAYTFGATLASVFQCQNPNDAMSTAAYFSQFDGVPGRVKKAKCYNPSLLWVFSAAVNLCSDVIILLLPIPALLSLRVPMSKRLALIGIFSIGIMAIVASCVRMWVMALWAESPINAARFGADLLLWGQVETNAGIISASVPFLRLLFKGRKKNTSAKQQVVGDPQKPPPRSADRALKIDPSLFFGDDEPESNSSPAWTPFITVPESLSSTAGSRGSGMLDHLDMKPVNAHLTV